MVEQAWRAVSLAVALTVCGLGACGQSTTEEDGPDVVNMAGRGGSSGGSGGASGGTSAGTSAGTPPYVAGYTGCFEAGSLVATPGGSVPIEQLAIGDAVLAFDERSGAVTPRQVTATFVHEVEASGRLALSDGRVLRVTAEHPIYDAGLGAYVRAEALTKSRTLVTLSQSLAPGGRSAGLETLEERVASVALVATTSSAFVSHSPGSPVTVFNISVGGLENYFVEGVLVHNKALPLCPPMPHIWPGGACQSQGSCLDPSNPEIEYVPLNQLSAAGGSAGGADNAAGGAGPDTGSGGTPDANGGAAPTGENAAVSVPICPAQAGVTAPFYLAVDYLMPDTLGGTPGFAIYAGAQACSGVELGQVWLNDAMPPPAGSLTTQCVPVSLVDTNLSVHSLHAEGEIKGLRFASSCEYLRNYRPMVNPGPTPFPCFQ
jgi:hypothetical protein